MGTAGIDRCIIPIKILDTGQTMLQGVLFGGEQGGEGVGEGVGAGQYQKKL